MVGEVRRLSRRTGNVTDVTGRSDFGPTAIGTMAVQAIGMMAVQAAVAIPW